MRDNLKGMMETKEDVKMMIAPLESWKWNGSVIGFGLAGRSEQVGAA